MNNININNVNLKHSSVHNEYKKGFYKIHEIEDIDIERLKEENNYFEDEVKEYINELDKEETRLIINRRYEIIESIIMSSIFFEPEKFNKAIAKKCRLVAFTYDNKNLLGYAGYGENMTPKLDAYQALVDGTIDERSLLFSDFKYFEEMINKASRKAVSTELTQEVIKAIQKN